MPSAQLAGKEPPNPGARSRRAALSAPGENNMRLLLGIIIGALLTVSVAFVADNWNAPARTSDASHRTMVNWDVVDDNLRIVRHRAYEMWTRLSQKMAG
jgi:hypothetical protein